MFNSARFYLIAGFVAMFCQSLFANIIVTGVVRDNGSEPVEGALVDLIDQADTTRVFSNVTNDQGEYSLQIIPTGIGNVIARQPGSFNLYQNYPNPFNPATVISYELARPSHIRLEIYNVLGQKIKTLFDGYQSGLFGRMMWNGINEQGQGVSAGVYIYSLIAGDTRLTRKMLLLDGHTGVIETVGQSAAALASGGPTGLGKTASDLYLLRVSGVDIETTVQYDLHITSSMAYDINVLRTVTDIDGNVYHTVKIGDQWWMAENLRVTHYNNGAVIAGITDSTQWADLFTGAYGCYHNDDNYATDYGLLYNWYALIDSNNIAPAGWHVPTDAEWKQLEMTLGMSQADADKIGWRGTTEGGKLKESGEAHWISPNSGATNESGFAARPGGFRDSNTGGYSKMGTDAHYWSATASDANNAWRRKLVYNGADIARGNLDKHYGFSVRCVRNTEPHIIPNPPGLVSPVNGSANIDVNTYLSWNEVANVDFYNLQVATDSNFTTLVLEENGLVTTNFQITNLSEGTTFYWRVNAANTVGVSDWSETWSFTTCAQGYLTDIDGNVYRTVKIGDQWWMAENLRVTHYRNGEPLVAITDSTQWAGLTSGAFGCYQNDSNYTADYGLLYNWYALIDSNSIAPDGWHVPTDTEWKQLEMALGMSQIDADKTGWRGTIEGGKLKEAGEAHWISPNSGATNESGFAARPGGFRDSNTGGYSKMGTDAHYWSATEGDANNAWRRKLVYNGSDIGRGNLNKHYGFSVRCVRNTVPHIIPNPPGLVSPVNGSANIDLNTYLIWSEVANVDFYNLQVANDSLFTTPVLEENGLVTTSFQLTNLSEDTTYYWRVNATNAAGTSAWSQNCRFTTITYERGTVTDIDGNVYQTVKIGDQWWMAENLQVTHYRNGDAIPNITDDSEWFNSSTGAWCYYNNDIANAADYGVLYNWFAVNDSSNLAPVGWHVPTDAEWKLLEITLGMNQYEADRSGHRGVTEGGKLKETGTRHWREPNTGATNYSGFTARPGGQRDMFGGFFNIYSFAYFWTASEYHTDYSWQRSLSYGLSVVNRIGDSTHFGLSVRLVRD